MKWCLIAMLGGLALAQDPADLLSRGKPAAAERALTPILRDHPDDLRALVLMGVALDQQQRYAQAEPYYRRALALAPREPAVLNNAANHWLAAGNTVLAKQTFLKVIAADPRHANANLQLARLEVADKRGAQALAALDRLPADAAADPAVMLLRARALHLSGKTAEAASVLDRLTASAGGDPRLNFTIGGVWAEWKRYEEAEQAFTRALTAEPLNRDVLYNLGVAALGAHHLERAREVLGTVLRQKPDDVDALVALARAHAEAGNLEMTLAVLAQARAFAPQRADILLLLAQATQTLGYSRDAATAYEEYLKLRPDDDDARRERGFALVQAQDLRQGTSELEAHLARHPKDATGWYELAVAFSVQDNDKAIEYLGRALALKPGWPAALYTRGVLQVQLGNGAAALPDLMKVIAAEPDNTRALQHAGQAYLLLDRPADALKALSRAAELAPRDRKVLMHYSQALRAVGRADEARAVLARFKQLGPERQRKNPFGGLLDFLNLPLDEQRARYFENLVQLAQRNPTDAALQFRLGNELLARSRAEEAIAAYRRAAESDPAPQRLRALARMLLDSEQYAAAREFLEPLVARQASPEARLDLAVASFHVQGPEAGLKELDTAPPAERQGDYFLLRAQMLEAMGRVDEAAEALNRGLRSAPTRGDLYLAAGQFLLRQRRYPEAIALLGQANRLVPDAPELRLAYATALELSRRTGDALKELAAVQARWPEWEKTYVTQGIILNVDRKPAEARQALETAIALGADTAEAYYFLALSITEAAPEDRAAAQQALDKALLRNPDDPYIRALTGKLALNGSDYQTAIEHLEQAVRLFPDYFQAHYNLANAYRALGDEDKALREMKEVRRIRQNRTKEELQLEMPPLPEVLIGHPRR